jgi:Bacterial PH domain
VNEPIPQRIAGVREDLPPGERVLWQGAPRWQTIAIRAYHSRKVAIYFALILALQLVARSADGLSASEIISALAPLTLAALTTLGLLALLSWATARTTIYAITNRRIYMRIGIALPLFVNLPFSGIDAASLRLNRDATGDIPIKLKGGTHLAYLHLWPHARPGHMKQPEPMLRAIPEAQAVAQILSQALAAAAGVAQQWRPDRFANDSEHASVVPTSAG